MHYQQRTLARSFRCDGTGVHSGKKVRLKIKPAPVNHGIKFVRTDLPSQPSINAHFNNVVDTSLATVIGDNGVIVSTIEHLMACFYGLAIDNAIVEVDAYEIPIMDGSAQPFAALIKSAGVQNQDGPKFFIVLKEPITFSDNGASVCAYPASQFKITCKINYNHPLISNQTFSFEFSENAFEEEICRARTFGFLAEIELLKKYGLAKGGSLDNAIVIDKDNIINKQGLRYPDEFVRHKILDCLGDFSLLGMPIICHVIATKSGHMFNHAFLKKLFSQKQSWETRSFEECYPHCEIASIS